MPTYSYICNKCNENFEIKMSMQEKDNSKSSCPKCKSNDIRQNYGCIGISSNSSNSTPSCPTGTCPFM